jgi:hypothetical protein
MVNESNIRLHRVQEQLRLYEHPLFEFSAHAKGDGVEVLIHPKGAAATTTQPDGSPSIHTYLLELHPRDLDHSQFEWQFQRQLYDALHDYLIEMFVRTPQDRTLRANDERRERGQ